MGEKGPRKSVKMRKEIRIYSQYKWASMHICTKMLMAAEKSRKTVEKNWQQQNTHQWTAMWFLSGQRDRVDLWVPKSMITFVDLRKQFPRVAKQ